MQYTKFLMAMLVSGLLLTGCSQAEQEQAKDEAQSTYEEAKEATKEAVDEAADATENAMQQTGEFLSDAAITGRVKAALTEASAIDAMNINVETIDGVVVLSGVVGSQDIADLAQQLAEGVEGVQDVENDIEVQDY